MPFDGVGVMGMRGRSPFPAIADYGFLSDGETTALVAPSGNVEWLCLPRMDSPSVFGSILDRDAGSFRIGPADVDVPAARRYLPGTMVLETTWETRMGWVIVRDALSIGPWHHETERSHSHRRSPTDHDADHVMLRLIECVQGSAEMKLDCEPAFDYGGLAADWEYTGPGAREHGRRCARATRRSSRWAGRRTGFHRTTTRPRNGWRARGSSGRSGLSTAPSPTTRGAPICSAAR
jgi:GH15 family glucan-1,4-alpha-glucosidase